MSAPTRRPAVDDPRPRRLRRRALLGGALALTGLAACDPSDGSGGGGSEAEETTPPLGTDTRVELTPLTTTGALVTSKPEALRLYPIAPGEGHGTVALLTTMEDGELRAQVIRPGSTATSTVPIDPATTHTACDGMTSPVRLYGLVVEGASRRFAMYTSRDLEQWESVELGTTIPDSIEQVGGGLLVTAPQFGALSIFEIADDGTVKGLNAPTISDGSSWVVRAVCRREEVIALLVEVYEREEAVPSIVSSGDGGASWSEPRPLPTSGERTEVADIYDVDGVFVVTGEHMTAPSWNDGARYRRPTAWSSKDGLEFVQEEVPLPVFAVDGYSFDGPGDITWDTPVAFLDVDVWGAVFSADRTELSLPMFFFDLCQIATRSPDGEWRRTHFTEPLSFTEGEIVGAVGGLDGVIACSAQVVETRAPETEFEEVLEASFTHSLRADRGDRASTPIAVHTELWREMTRTPEQLAAFSEQHHRLVSVHEDRLVPAGGLDGEIMRGFDLRVHHPREDLALAIANAREDDDSWGPLIARVRQGDDGWKEADGLPDHSSPEPGSPVAVDDDVLLPLSFWDEDDEGTSVLASVVLASPDGLRWEQHSTVDFSEIEGGLAGSGGGILAIRSHDHATLGVGWIRNGDDQEHPAVFVLDGERWVAKRPEGTEGVGRLISMDVVSGVIVAHGDLEILGETRDVHLQVDADGATTELYRATDAEGRSLPLDLGDGALLASGWVNHPEGDEHAEDVQTAIGSCLWASADGGATWGATVVPGQEGRDVDLTLLRDGDDLLLMVDDPGTPHAYRIIDPRGQILGESSPD